MKISTITSEFTSPVEAVWNIVTDNINYTWRSDLSKISLSENGNSFTEYTKNGFETTFTITHKEPFKRYEFDISNKNMNGHWTGVFSKSNRGTKVVFTEAVSIKNPVMNLLAGPYLKKQQTLYISDLKKALGE